MMKEYFLLLPVLFPILAGFSLYLFRFSTAHARYLYCGIVIGLSTILTWLCVLFCGEQAFTLLPFSGDVALVFRLDGAGRLFAALSSALWPFATVYGFDYMKHSGHMDMFWCFFTAAFGITMGIAFAGNMMTLYLFYELLTLVTIPLIMEAMTKRAVKAGVRYAAYSMFGAALGFVGLVYLITNGAQDFIPGGHNLMGESAVVVFFLSFVGFAVKAAIWPLHSWLPTAAVAPTPVTALLHAVAVVKAGAFACIRLTYYTFGTEGLRGTRAQQAVMILTVLTLVYGSARALREPHFKRRMAYSTISNLSYILFAVSLMTPLGLTAAFLHFIFHSIIKIDAFFATGAVRHYTDRKWVTETEGLGRHMPWTFACFTAAAFALTGIPPFNGFVSKWYLGLAALDAGTPLALIGFGGILLSALFTAVYMFQVVVKAWFPRRDAPPVESDVNKKTAPLMWVPMVILSVASLVLGICPGWLIDIIERVVSLI